MAFSESLQTAPINAALFTLGFLINLAVAEWVVRPAPATLEVVS